MAAGKHRKNHDVEQTKKMTPPLVNMSASWFLVSTYLIWILGSKLILSNNLSNATLWVRDTCLIVRLLPFMIMLDHSLIVFRNVQLNFELRRFCACDNVIHIRKFIIFSVTVSCRLGVGVGALDLTACSTSRHLIIDLFFSTVISHCLMGVL